MIRIKEKQDIDTLTTMFSVWSDTTIWSCLQNIMGEIYVEQEDHSSQILSAVSVLGDFAFFTGVPSETLLRFIDKHFTGTNAVYVPLNDKWNSFIEQLFHNRAHKATRYALKKEAHIFDLPKLQQYAKEIPAGFELRLIDEPLYNQCKKENWTYDFVGNYTDYALFQKYGLGYLLLCDNEIVAGASSYSGYDHGIEVIIETKASYRQKGFARLCVSKLICTCEERNLYPSWDAKTQISLHLAEKLGYHFDQTYEAYEIDAE